MTYGGHGQREIGFRATEPSNPKVTVDDTLYCYLNEKGEPQFNLSAFSVFMCANRLSADDDTYVRFASCTGPRNFKCLQKAADLAKRKYACAMEIAFLVTVTTMRNARIGCARIPKTNRGMIPCVSW